LPQNARVVRRRIDALTSQPPVPGRVIAVLTDTDTDTEGGTFTSHTPVIAFATHQGTAVTAYCPDDLPGPTTSRGRDVTIHYDPADPAVFTPNLASEDRSRALDITCGTVALLIGVAAAVVGAALL
jgi:hypothetical protein